jgi:predicted nucleotidyltransferase
MGDVPVLKAEEAVGFFGEAWVRHGSAARIRSAVSPPRWQVYDSSSSFAQWDNQEAAMATETLSLTDKKLLERCLEAVLGVEPSAEVVLYGSRARGDATVESDYDLLVLVDGEGSMGREERVRDRLYPIELETGAVLTVHLETRQRWNSPLFRAMPFVQVVDREGIRL